MTDVQNLTDEQLHEAVFDLVNREMGPTAFVRFLQSIQPGSGDYTADRQAWVESLTADEILTGIGKLRQQQP